jgi:hypothetical protein
VLDDLAAAERLAGGAVSRSESRSGAGRQEPVFRSVVSIACRFAIRIRLTVGAAGIKSRKTGDGTDRVNLSALGEPARAVLRAGMAIIF